MVQLIGKNNYFFIISDGQIFSDQRELFHFQKQPDGKYDVIYNGSLIFDGLEYSDFEDYKNEPFASAELFEDFYTSNSGNSSISGDSLNVLNDVLQAVIAIDENTDTIETKITDLINDVNSGNQDVKNKIDDVITELQSLNVNTSDIENLLISISTEHNLVVSTTTTITSTTTSQQALAANSNRKELIIENLSNQRVYVKFGGTATTSNCTFSLGQFEKSPKTSYQGAVHVINAAATSSVVLTQITK